MPNNWYDRTWDPVVGCTSVSNGCVNCTAQQKYHRYIQNKSFYTVQQIESVLDDPLKWILPAKVLVSFMGDLFHDKVEKSYIDRVFDVMEKASKHHFFVLSKRVIRMRNYCNERYSLGKKPVNHIWLGTSVEDQVSTKRRVLPLLETKASGHFLCAEPLLDSIDLENIQYEPGQFLNAMTGIKWEVDQDQTATRIKEMNALDWVICSGEIGPGARPLHPDDVKMLRDQCSRSFVPFYFLSWGEFEWLKSSPKRVGRNRTGQEIEGSAVLEYPAMLRGKKPA